MYTCIYTYTYSLFAINLFVFSYIYICIHSYSDQYEIDPEVSEEYSRQPQDLCFFLAGQWITGISP